MLFGLCGSYDDNVTNDFTKRDQSVAPLEPNPSGPVFPDSWEVTGNCTIAAGRRKRDATDVEGCDVDNSTKDALLDQCSDVSQMANGSVPDAELQTMMADCMFDLCSVYKNTSGDSAALTKYLGEILTSTEEIVDSSEKTTDNDPIPPPLTTAPPTTTVPPPDSAVQYPQENCQGGMCNVHVQVKIVIN
ncbi:hypothetical protein SK128_014397 [Halocaridina rubra]|uniref:VWFD domain-containing protein n=1 Tax=Halocaridina rubra TaxID=373956 RepID=A0AAN8XC40_HALRR